MSHVVEAWVSDSVWTATRSSRGATKRSPGSASWGMPSIFVGRARGWRYAAYHHRCPGPRVGRTARRVRLPGRQHLRVVVQPRDPDGGDVSVGPTSCDGGPGPEPLRGPN